MLDRSTLLILGAGSDQTYAIRTAREEGLRVLAVDSNPNAPGLAMADEAAAVSNRDVIALKELCNDSARRGFPVAGILTMGADIPHIAAELALHLGIPGPSRETGRWTTDKFLMKQRLAEAGVAVPWFAKVASAANLRQVMAAHGGRRFVLKPTNQSGARGVLMVDALQDDLEALYAEVESEAIGGEVQVEAFIQGRQISTESIIWESKCYTPGFVDRNYEMLERFKPYVIENGGFHPSEVQGVRRADVEDLIQRASHALGIKNGVAKGDVVIAVDGTPMIIEVAARLSGGDFSESLIPLGCGVNIVKAAIQIAVGQPPDLLALADRWERVIANRYFFGEPGRLLALHGVEEVRSLPWVHKLEIYVKPGDTVDSIKFHSRRLGVFVVEADNREELDSRINDVYNRVRFDISP